MLLLMVILVCASSISLERLAVPVRFFYYYLISSPWFLFLFIIYSDPGLSKVVAAPIIKLKDVKDLVQPHTVLVTPDEMEDFFTRHVPLSLFFFC